jgi:hypothetical protein
MSATKLLMSHGLSADEAWGAQILGKAARCFPKQYHYAKERALRSGDSFKYLVRWAQRKLQRG